MEAKITIETLGYILKEEILVSVRHNIISDTLVLEIQNPYPGYHGKFQPEEHQIPEFIFFVTKEKYTTEHLFRTTANVQKYFGKDLDIARGELTIYNNVYNCFRIKGCKDYTRINELQLCFKSEGLQFAKGKKMEVNSLIKVQKTFSVEEISENIYIDLEDSNYYYFQIPLYLNWEQFRTLTKNIKNNFKNNNFDAALAMFYRKHRVVDLVRIFDVNPDIEKLKDIEQKYFAEIKRFMLDKYNLQ